MIREVPLAVGAWLTVTVLGLPVDPLLPGVVSLGLTRQLSGELRLALTVAVALVGAALCGQPQGEVLARYLLTAGLAVRWAPTVRGTPRSRVLVGLAGCVVVWGGQGLGAWLGSSPTPAATLVWFGGTGAWLGLHGLLVRWRR